jgi:hypothetical protein
MKRKLLFAALFLFVLWIAQSCNDQGDCQSCKIVERDSNHDVVSSGPVSEYCGSDIDDYKSANPPVTNPVTGNITQVECH